MTAWIGWVRQLAELGSESRLLSRSYCPVGSALSALEEAAFPPPPTFPVHPSAGTLQSGEASLAKRASLWVEGPKPYGKPNL